jgi:uncharacterized Zn-finger protein
MPETAALDIILCNHDQRSYIFRSPKAYVFLPLHINRSSSSYQSSSSSSLSFLARLAMYLPHDNDHLRKTIATEPGNYIDSHLDNKHSEKEAHTQAPTRNPVRTNRSP